MRSTGSWLGLASRDGRLLRSGSWSRFVGPPVKSARNFLAEWHQITHEFPSSEKQPHKFMKFANLDRLFIPLKGDDPTIDWGPSWGRKYGGWLTWDELLARNRVALLAEALSGKTAELHERVRLLRHQGRRAFFVPIEDLADDSFEGALSEEDCLAFEAWKTQEITDAWFFLDSIDEARLNGKKLTVALRKFSKAVTLANLGRAHVLVTCRASDWKGKADREAIEQALPYVEASAGSTEVTDPDEEFLSPLFNRQESTHRNRNKISEPHPSELFIVQIAPLSNAQKMVMAEKAGVASPAAFLEAVNKNGLDTMTERPGDLVEIVEYWQAYGSFGSLAEMTEEGVKRKLREEDRHRVDSANISEERARLGAEQIAAALVMAKTFTLKSPSHDTDPSLSTGAIDSAEVLADWDQSDINALLRRGLFAPATYGRIRFHHRASQEYLAARWLQRLLEQGCSQDEVRRVLFVERYGIKTVVPTLRAVAAWLAQWQPQIRDEIVRREPVSLIAHGDPKSLPLPVRAALLRSYAALHAKGQLNAENIDYRAAWMFSNPALADAVRQAWQANARDDFRQELLCFIEEGPIAPCKDLASATALDGSTPDYTRARAARAMSACGDDDGLRALAAETKTHAAQLSARLAPQFALVLFPRYLSVPELLDLIDQSEAAQPYKTEGFGPYLAQLHQGADNRTMQRQLAGGVAALCLSTPHADEHTPVSRRHLALGKDLADLALTELTASNVGDTDPSLLRLLMAVERADGALGTSDAMVPLAAKVRADTALNRALMWADFDYTRAAKPAEDLPTRFWQIGPHTGRALWSISIADITWLADDCRSQRGQQERQVAFSGILDALFRAEQFEAQRALVDEIAATDAVLQADLDRETAPKIQSKSDLEHEAYVERSKAKQNDDKRSWIEARDKWKANPASLSDPEELTKWDPGQARLYDATTWVKLKAREAGLDGPRHWAFLGSTASALVAEHYASGMRQVWRLIKPERPAYTDKNSYSTKRSSQLAIDAISIDSANPQWETLLSADEADLAIRHACYTGNNREDWVARLITAHPDVALPRIEEEVAYEYKSEGQRGDVLAQAAHNESAARPTVTRKVLELFEVAEAVDDGVFDRTISTLVRGLVHVPHKSLEVLAARRLRDHLQSGNDKRATAYFGLYGALNPNGMAEATMLMLVRQTGESPSQHSARVQRWLGSLFAARAGSGSAAASISRMSSGSIVRLLKISYAHVAPEQDEEPPQDGTPSNRGIAEDARSTLFNALIAKPGAEAFYALRDLAADPLFTPRAIRMHELAHAKAEADGDLVPWEASEFFRFNRTFNAPVKTGEALWRLVLAVLSDISSDFDHADASSRSLVAQAGNEEAVQTWLAEQLRLRSTGRYHVYREAEVSNRNEPDIVVASTSAAVEVAVEIKNANKRWTVGDLKDALHGQLSRDYLRTPSRRHGILVVSLHRLRTWRPTRGNVWNFAQLITYLSEVAASIESNESGAVDIAAIGLDAVDRG